MPKKLDHVDAMFKYMEQYPAEQPGGAMWQRFEREVLEPRHDHLLADLKAHAEPEDARRISDACRMFKGHIIKLVMVLILAGALLAPARASQDAPGRTIAGQIYTGAASWYSRASCLKESGQAITASGAPLDDSALTAAAWGFPFGTRLRVTNIKNGRSVVVLVSDRGPAKSLVVRGRIIDLTVAAFKKLAPLAEGIVEITMEVL